MSDTPITNQHTIQFGDGPAKYVYAAVAANLERENLRLRAEIEELLNDSSEADYKRGYDEGHDEGCKAMLSAMQEIYEPILKVTAKDSERLDWILSDAGGFWLSTREDINKEMNKSK